MNNKWISFLSLVQILITRILKPPLKLPAHIFNHVFFFIIDKRSREYEEERKNVFVDNDAKDTYRHKHFQTHAHALSYACIDTHNV